jgi:hypothetical protein
MTHVSVVAKYRYLENSASLFRRVDDGIITVLRQINTHLPHRYSTRLHNTNSEHYPDQVLVLAMISISSAVTADIHNQTLTSVISGGS